MKKPVTPAKPKEMVEVIYCYRKDGWFCFDVRKVDKEVIEKGEVTNKIEPDIMPTFLSQLSSAAMGIFGV